MNIHLLAMDLVLQEQNAPPPLSLEGFIKEFWSVLEPATEYRTNWHIQAVCDHLEAMTRHDIKRLVINIPPGHMKSLMCCVFWPAWSWAENDPATRWLFTSYDATLSTRDSIKCRRLVTHPLFKERYPSKFTLSGDQNLKTYFENSRTGFRMASSVAGTGTGARANFIVCDDPHKVSEAESDAVRNRARDWWATEMSNRGSSEDSGYLVIQQRVHYEDVAGWCREHGYEYLVIPSEFEGQQSKTFLNWEDPRKTDGELLWPERFGQEYLEEQKEALGSYGYAGQHQQRPAPRDGGMINPAWFGYYDKLPVFEEVVMSIDTAYKPKLINDPWVALVFGVKKGLFYLIWVYRKRCNYPDGKRMIIRAIQEREPTAILIEDEGSGQALIPELREEYPEFPVIALDAEKDKLTRLSTTSPTIEAGKLLLPEKAPWLADYINEMITFPMGRNDDQVDATSQFINWRNKKRAKIVDLTSYVRRAARY